LIIVDTIRLLAASRSCETAFSLSLVCRFSNEVATPLLWHSPHIRNSSKALSFLLALNQSWNRLGRLVKSLSLACDRRNDAEEPCDEMSSKSITPDDPEWIIQRLPQADKYSSDEWTRDELIWHSLQVMLYEFPNLTSLGMTLETRERFKQVHNHVNPKHYFTMWPPSDSLNPVRCIALSGSGPDYLEPRRLPTHNLHLYGCRNAWINWTPWLYMTLYLEPKFDGPLRLCLSLYSIDGRTKFINLLAHLDRRRRRIGLRPFETIVLRVRKRWAKWVLDRLTLSRWKGRHKVQVRLWETGVAKSVGEAQAADFANGSWESWVDELDCDGLHEGIGRLLTSTNIQGVAFDEDDVESDDSSHADGEGILSAFFDNTLSSEFEAEEIL